MTPAQLARQAVLSRPPFHASVEEVRACPVCWRAIEHADQPPPPPERERLMSAVTGAVFRAEGSLREAITHYLHLAVAEQAIADSLNPNVTLQDREIAKRGVTNAQRILRGLDALQNSDADP